MTGTGWRGVLFDLDGTLADTLHTIAAALNGGLRALGLPEHGPAAVAGMVGEGVRVLCQKGLPPGREDLLDDLLLAVRAAYDADPMRHCRLYDGIADMLRELRGMGARMAVLSNKPDPLTVQTVTGLGIAPYFEQVIGHRAEFPFKPDPISAWWIAARMELDPAEILYVGDTPIDLATAKAGGFPSMAVTWGFRSRAELIAHAPDHVAEHPRDVVSLFRSRRG